jgi:hypothetical protein
MSLPEVIDMALGNLRFHDPQVADHIPRTLYIIRFVADALAVFIRCVSDQNGRQTSAKLEQLRRFHLLQSQSQLAAAKHLLIEIMQQYRIWVTGTIFTSEQLIKFNHLYKKHAILAAKGLKQPDFHKKATPVRSIL